MSLPFHNKVKLWGYVVEDAQLTFNISGVPAPQLYPGALTEPDQFPWLRKGGLAMTLDLTQPNTMKPAGAGDKVYGKLMTLGVISDGAGIMGAVALKFADTLPIDPAGAIPAIGDSVVGSSAGTVAKGPADPHGAYVVDVIDAPARLAPVTKMAVVIKL